MKYDSELFCSFTFVKNPIIIFFMKKILALFSVVVLSISIAHAQIVTLTSYASGFTKPVDIKNAGDSRLFVVEQTGRIKIVDSTATVMPSPFLNLSSIVSSQSANSGDERGLLGLAFHPDFKNNGYFYVDYTMNGTGRTQISRFSVSATNPDSADPASEVNLLDIYQPYSNHNGGNLQFGPDGYLYIDMGDGGSAGDPGSRAQNVDTLLGKILRIDVNVASAPYYAAPPSNPFYGATPGRDEIWAYGVRNPWRASFDKLTGDFWIADVGQNLWEEIDFQPAGSPGGQNYGWKCREGQVAYGGCTSISSDTVGPIAVYAHTGGSCSVTGGYIYRGSRHEALFGYYFYIDYCSGKMHSIKNDGMGAWLVNDNVGTFSTYAFTSFGQDSKGELYICNILNGTIYRLDNPDCKPVSAIVHNNAMPDAIQFCKTNPLTLNAWTGDSLAYQWLLNGSPILGATAAAYAVDSAGTYSLVTMRGLCSDTSQNVLMIDTCVVIAGMQKEVFSAPMRIYPNPSSGIVNVAFSLAQNQAVLLQVKNLLGQTLFIERKNVLPGASSWSINTAEMPSGIYFLSIQAGGSQRVEKLIISHKD